MAVYNGGYPMTYQNPYSYLAAQTYATPQPVMQAAPPQQAQSPAQNPQMMTPPTIRAEIIQVDNEAAGEAFPVGVGASQMMITRDEQTILVKSANQSGTTVEYYDKRPPAPKPKQIAPESIVTWDALEKWMAERTKPASKKKEAASE